MYIPKEIFEALQKVEEGMEREYKEKIVELQYRELYKLHFGLGTWIRNTFLEKGGSLYNYFLGVGLDNADNMSTVLIMYLYFHLKSKKSGR